MVCLLEVPYFASVYNSKIHFSFVFDSSRIWNDLPDDVLSAKSLSFDQKEVENLSLCKSTHTLLFSSLSLWRYPLQYFWLNDYHLCFLVLGSLESVNRWRLSAIKVLLEL